MVPYDCIHIRDLDPKVAGCSGEVHTRLYPGEGAWSDSLSTETEGGDFHGSFSDWGPEVLDRFGWSVGQIPFVPHWQSCRKGIPSSLAVLWYLKTSHREMTV